MTAGDESSASVWVSSNIGVENARRLVRRFCLDSGLPRQHAEEMVVATSELATNLVRHSTSGGTITCRIVQIEGKKGIEVECIDDGPGIADLAEAQKEGFSTRGSMGRGLSSAKHLADDFEIESLPSATRIRIRKWLV